MGKERGAREKRNRLFDRRSQLYLLAPTYQAVHACPTALSLERKRYLAALAPGQLISQSQLEGFQQAPLSLTVGEQETVGARLVTRTSKEGIQIREVGK